MKSIFLKSCFGTLLLISILFWLWKIFQLLDILVFFPTQDFASHLARLSFFKDYGFQTVPLWYNGFQLFSHYFPGYYLFSLPLTFLFNDIRFAFVSSIWIIFLLGIVVVKWFSSRINTSTFTFPILLVLLFANPFSINAFLYFGRIPELLAWVLFVAGVGFLLSYLKRPLDYLAGSISVVYSFIILTNLPVAALFSFLGIGFIIAHKEKLKAALLLVIPWVITSIWWVNLVLHPVQNPIYADKLQAILLGNAFSIGFKLGFFLFFIISSLFFLVLFFSVRRKISIEFGKFLLPSSILAFLCLSLIILKVPLFNGINPFSYSLFFLFLIGFLLLHSEISKLFSFSTKLIVVSTHTVVFFIFLVISLPLIFTIPTYSVATDASTLLEDINGRFVVVGGFPVYEKYSLYAQGAMDYRLETPFGWFPEEMTSFLLDNEKKLNSGNCELIGEAITDLGVAYVLSNNDFCSKLINCKLKNIKNINRTCLLKVEK